MAITVPSVNPFHAAIINHRWRLISMEPVWDNMAAQFAGGLLSDWKKWLNNDIKKALAGAEDYPRALARRRVSILRQFGLITEKQLVAYRQQLLGKSTNIFASEYYRHAASMQQHIEQVGAVVSMSFHRLNTQAVKAALSNPLYGVAKAAGFNGLNVAVEGKMKRAIAETIAHGKGHEFLADRMQQIAPMAKHHATSVARTALMSTSSMATETLYLENRDILGAVMWEATFDRRTCGICGGLHGRQWPIDQAPPQPAHYQCRCTLLPVFSDPALNENDIRPERDAWNNITYKQSDRFFDGWLRKQPESVARQTLGSDLKYEVWKKGIADLTDLVKPNLQLLTDNELQAMLDKLPKPPTKGKFGFAVRHKFPTKVQAGYKSDITKKTKLQVPREETKNLQILLDDLKGQRDKLATKLEGMPVGSIGRPQLEQQLKELRRRVRSVRSKLNPSGADIGAKKNAVRMPVKPPAPKPPVKVEPLPKAVESTATKTPVPPKLPVKPPVKKPHPSKIVPGQLSEKQKAQVATYKEQLKDLYNQRESLSMNDPLRKKLTQKIGNTSQRVKKYEPDFKFVDLVKQLKKEELAKAPVPKPAPVVKATQPVVSAGKKSKTARNIDELNVDDFPTTQAKLDSMKKVSGPTGSNPAQWYEDAAGQQWLVKEAPDEEHAFNEVVASLWYKANGIATPDITASKIGGKWRIISKKVEGLKSVTQNEVLKNEKLIKQIQEHFVEDVAAANWDVVGLKFDNILVDNAGKVWRVDTGGAMAFRAQGAAKPGWATANGFITDIANMRDEAVAKQAGKVFGSLDSATVRKSVKKFVNNFDDATSELMKGMEKLDLPRNLQRQWLKAMENRRDGAVLWLEKKAASVDERLRESAAKFGFEVLHTPKGKMYVSSSKSISRNSTLAKRYKNNLPWYQFNAVKSFTGSGYGEMRRVQYEFAKKVSAMSKTERRTFLKAVAKNPKKYGLDAGELGAIKCEAGLRKMESFKYGAQQNVELHRGIRFNTKTDLEKFFNQILDDGYWTLDSSTSTSINVRTANNFSGSNYGVIVRIKPPASGTSKSFHGRVAAPISSHKSEEEVIFQAGSRFKVDKIHIDKTTIRQGTYTSQSRVVIEVTEVEPDAEVTAMWDEIIDYLGDATSKGKTLEQLSYVEALEPPTYQYEH